MSKDTIYRQAAIDAFDCSISGVPFESMIYVSEYADKMISRIKALPSAPPERKKSKWILKPYIYGVAYCSECDYAQYINNTNYCPNCGADMRTPTQVQLDEADDVMMGGKQDD